MIKIYDDSKVFKLNCGAMRVERECYVSGHELGDVYDRVLDYHTVKFTRPIGPRRAARPRSKMRCAK